MLVISYLLLYTSQIEMVDIVALAAKKEMPNKVPTFIDIQLELCAPGAELRPPYVPLNDRAAFLLMVSMHVALCGAMQCLMGVGFSCACVEHSAFKTDCCHIHQFTTRIHLPRGTCTCYLNVCVAHLSFLLCAPACSTERARSR
jgi:hypothetical protein